MIQTLTEVQAETNGRQHSAITVPAYCSLQALQLSSGQV